MNRKRFLQVAGDSDWTWDRMQETGKLWALDLCICLKQAGGSVFDLQKEYLCLKWLFPESQIFLKYFAK